MKIAILGTRGIPNYYGGFEQCAEYLAFGFQQKGHEVYVYNSHNHPYKEKTLKGVNIIHKFDPEKKIGTFGQFWYDLLCIIDSRKRGFDVILQLGYTSNSIWAWLLPRKPVIVTNMDGLEWKRTQYAKPVQKFVRYAEKLGVKTSDYIIADSKGMQVYFKETYNAESTYIAYGAHLFDSPNEDVLKEFGVESYKYDMQMARFEPENNLEMILDAYRKTNRIILVFGNYKRKFGFYLIEKFKDYPNIRFMGGIYDIDKLNSLRYYSDLYYHGHCMGGTNPSMLEAMASNTFIISHDNPFNRAIMGDETLYFKCAEDIEQIYNSGASKEKHADWVAKNRQKIIDLFTWDKIVNQYEQLLQTSFDTHKLKNK